MPEYNRPFSDEMISAYLDNELTDEERAQVEAWVKQDPAARELMEKLAQLRSQLRAALQQPSTRPIDTQFTQRVLERIRQQQEVSSTGESKPLRTADTSVELTRSRARQSQRRWRSGIPRFQC